MGYRPRLSQARKPLLLIGLTALLAACSLLPGASPRPPDALGALAQHQAQWQAKGLNDYTFTITPQCFCPFSDPLDVTVAGGVATRITKAGQPVAPREVEGLPKTVPELFAVLSARAGAAKLSVEWDPTFGFPASIQVDPIANAIDDEFGYLITNFRPAS